MSNNKATIWQSEATQRLAEVLATIDDKQTMRNFLRDAMTEKEIVEISARLEVAKMLLAGSKYADIVAKTKLSSRTVARISDWIKNGCNGYRAVIETKNFHHSHIPPARAV